MLLSVVTPNDPLLAQQYALQKIDAPDAWGITTGSSDVVVAVLDSGIDLNNPDLAANIWTNPKPNANPAEPNAIHGWNFLDNNNNVQDNNVHGTAVSSVLGAVTNNGTGIAGVDWNVKILPIEVGTLFGVDDNAVAAGINYVTQLKKQGVNIVAINASYISFTPPTGAEISAIRSAGDAGILYVAAAGNAGLNLDNFYPSSFVPSNLIFVASTDQNDQLASDSSYGHNTVAVGAPGVDATVDIPGGLTLTLSGTSFAAPIVSGIAALLKSRYPAASMSQIKNAILSSGDPDPALIGKTITGKRVNALKALQALDVQVPPTGAVQVLNPNLAYGWAYDQNAGAAPIKVQISINGKLQPPILAGNTDPSAPAAYRSHGFAFSFRTLPPGTLTSGNNAIKVFALDNLTGALTQIGAGTLFADNPAAGTLVVNAAAITGTAQDPDTPAQPVKVQLTLDGKPWKTLATAPNHRFTLPLAQLPAGVHRLDAYALDTYTGKGSRPAALIGTALVSGNRAPVGAVLAFSPAGVVGYALDPDSPKPIQVRYRIDNDAPVFVLANHTHPGPMINHGFSFPLPQLPAGDHTVIVEAVDPVSDQLVQLTSQTFTVTNPDGSTLSAGSVQFTQAKNGLTVHGTVADPDATTPARIRIDIDGKPTAPFTAAGTATAGEFAFSQLLKLSKGPHRIDVYAFDQPSGTPVLISRQLVGYTASRATLVSAKPRQMVVHVITPAFVRLDIDGQTGALLSVRPGNVTIPVPPLSSGSHHLVLNLVDPVTLDTTALYDNSITYA
ncbi:MAG: S8 family serine peptidase [Phycisphaerae bacterium]